MGGAHATGYLQILLQSCAGPVQPHLKGVRTYAKLVGDCPRRLSPEVDLGDDFGVGRPQSRQKVMQARAHPPIFLGIGVRGKVMEKLLVGALACALLSVNVDDGTPKDLVEPCLGAGRTPQWGIGLKSPEQAFLYRVCRQIRMCQTLTGEGSELGQMVEQVLWQSIHTTP